MTDEQQFEAWAIREGLISESHGVRFVNSMCDVAKKAWQARALLAAGASEGQADREDLENCRTVIVQQLRRAEAYEAEIAALRERIAGMEKDAERYRMIRNRSDYWRENGRQATLVGVWEEELDLVIDAAIAKEPK